MAAKKKPKKSALGAGCLILFALPFAGVGAFMGYRFVDAIIVWQSAKSWDQTPVTLRKLELKRSQSDKGGTSYRVLAEYDYQYQGQSYTSTRVGLFSGGDNVSRFNNQLHARLKALRDQGKPILAFVNPNRPSQALLSRQMRLGMLTFHVPFFIMMGGAGFSMLGYAGYYLREQRSQRDLAMLHPDEPWRWRKDWARGMISQTQTKLAAWIGAAVVWNITCGAVLAVALNIPSPERVLFAVIVGLNLVGLLLLLHVGRMLLRRWRYGVSRLELATTPGVIGGRLTGVVHVPGEVPAENGFTARLLCQQRRTSKRSGENSTSLITLWEDQRQIARVIDTGSRHQTAIPIAFTIPSDARHSAPDADWPITWTLKLAGVIAGPDYRAEFVVPVFLTEDSQDGVRSTDQALTEYEADPSLAAILAREGIRVLAHSPQELTVLAPPLRSPLTALGLTSFTVLWFGVIGLLVQQGKLIAPGVMSLLGLIGLYATGSCLLNGSKLTIVGDHWTARWGWRGMRRTRQFSPATIQRITAEQYMSSSSSDGESQRWVSILAYLRDNQQAKLVHSLKNPKAERMLLAELRNRARLPGKHKSSPAANAKLPATDAWDQVLDLPADGDSE